MRPKLRTALDRPADELNAAEKDIVSNVRKFGWQTTSVLPLADEEETLGFSYTIGFWQSFGFPEILIFSLPSSLAHGVFSALAGALQGGEQIPIGERTNRFFSTGDGVLIPVAKRHYKDYLLSDRWFYGGDDFPCVQLVWTDRANRLPWEDGFEAEFADDQPDLSEHSWAEAIRPARSS